MTAIWKNRTYRMSAILLCLAAAGEIHAKYINLGPDVTSAAYWDSHDIAVVTVTAAGPNSEGAESITYQVDNLMSGELPGPARTVPVSRFWQGPGGKSPVHIAVNDRFIFYYEKQQPSIIVARPLDGGPAGSRVLAALRQIAKLRQDRSDQQAYITSLAARDPTVARYCLRHLLEQQAAPASASDIAAVLRFRDDESQEIQVRALAGQLASRMEGGGDHSDAEYSWLRDSLSKATAARWQDLAPLVDRLSEFEARRSDTIAFLTRLVINPNSALPVRIAAYGSFEDPRIFSFAAPDAESERILDACMQMLRDREPAIRGAGAALLHNIITRVNPVHAPGYVKRSAAAVSDAIGAENDPEMRRRLGHYLELLLSLFQQV